MIKTTVGEYDKFYNDNSFWKEDTVIEGDIFEIDGEEMDSDDYQLLSLSPLTKLIVKEGYVYNGETQKDLGSLESNFKKWKKLQTSCQILIEIDKEKEEELKELVKNIGGKIIK